MALALHIVNFFIKFIIVVVVAVLSFAPGAIFSEDQKDSSIELAFKYAVYKINKDRSILPKTTLVYDIQVRNNSIEITKPSFVLTNVIKLSSMYQIPPTRFVHRKKFASKLKMALQRYLVRDFSI